MNQLNDLIKTYDLGKFKITKKGDEVFLTVYRRFAFFFKKKKHNIPLSKLVGVVPFKTKSKFHIRNRVAFLSTDSFTCAKAKVFSSSLPELIKLLNESGANMPLRDANLQLLSNKYSIGDVLNLSSVKTIPLGTPWVYDGITYVAQRDVYGNIYLGYFNAEELSKLVFFSGSKKGAYLGYDQRQYDLELDKNDVPLLKQHLTERGADKIGETTGERFTHMWHPSDIINFKNWFRKEEVTIGEDFIAFDFKKGNKTDRIYLPIEEVYVNKTTKRFFWSMLKIYGRQNIVSQRHFPRGVANKIKSKLKQNISNNTMCTDHWRLFNLLPIISLPKRGGVGLYEDGILIMTRKEQQRENKALPFFKVPFEYIIKYGVYKPSFWSGRRHILIHANTGNFRKDQLGQNHVLLGFYNLSYTSDLREKLEKNHVSTMSRRDVKSHLRHQNKLE